MFTPRRKWKLWRGAKKPKPVVAVVAAAKPKRTRRKKIKRTGALRAKTPAPLTSHVALHRHLDASRHKDLLPLSDTFEPCTTLNNAVRSIQVLTANKAQYVGIVWTPSGARVLKRGVNPDTGNQNTFFIFDECEALNDEPHPISLRASRMSMTIRNTGVAQTVQGVVRICVAAQPFEIKNDGGWGLHGDTMAAMESLFAHHPAVQTLSAEKLRTAHRVNAHLTNYTQSRKFYKHMDWVASSSNDDVKNLRWHQNFAQMSGEMPIQQIWIEFPPVPHNSNYPANQYELVAHFQDAAIYPLDTLGGRMMSKPPAAHPNSPTVPGGGTPPSAQPAGSGPMVHG